MHRSKPALFRSLFVAFVVALAALSACKRPTKSRVVEGGDEERGRQAIQRYGCGSCHIIPGVPGAEGRTSHPLLGFSHRPDIAGSVGNTPDMLVKWIQDPRSLAPGTRMPNLNVTESDARDIAAYLYTLR